MVHLVLPFLRSPLGDPPDGRLPLAPPVRLTRHRLTLEDGHRVGIAVAGRGAPFVVVHGFGVESLLYAQPLARLAALGFQVVAVDAGGHGHTQPLPGTASLDDYVALLSKSLDALGIRRCVLAGHSMGGRFVAELAARRPDLVIALVLVDAIVGESWDRVAGFLRRMPPAVLGYGAALAVDTVASVPVAHDVRQALKLGRRIGPTVSMQLARPWRGLWPAVALLRAPSSVGTLDRLRDGGTVVASLHGERDLLVPLQAARETVARTDGALVVVRGGSHSWLLRCPETFPAIVGELLEGRLGEARDAALRAEGVDPATAGAAELEAACTRPGGVGAALGVELEHIPLATRRSRPRYQWTLEPVAAPTGAASQSRSTTTGA